MCTNKYPDSWTHAPFLLFMYIISTLCSVLFNSSTGITHYALKIYSHQKVNIYLYPAGHYKYIRHPDTAYVNTDKDMPVYSLKKLQLLYFN